MGAGARRLVAAITGSILMGDLIYIGVGVGGFALLVLFVYACGRA